MCGERSDIYRALTQNGNIIINGDASSLASIRVGTISAGKTSGGTQERCHDHEQHRGHPRPQRATHNNVTLTLFNSYVSQFGPLTGLTAARFPRRVTAFGIQGLTTQVDTLDATSTRNLSAEMILTQTGRHHHRCRLHGGGDLLRADEQRQHHGQQPDQRSASASQITLITTGGWIKQSSGHALQPPRTS